MARSMQNNPMAALYKGLSAVKYNEESTITDGLKAYVKLKIEEHQKGMIKSRIGKLERDEARLKRKIEEALRQTHFVNQIQNQRKRKWMEIDEFYKTNAKIEKVNRDKFTEEKRK